MMMTDHDIATSILNFEKRISALEKLVSELDVRTVGLRRVGGQHREVDHSAAIKRIVEKMDIKPIDRSAQQLVDGSPVPEDRSHTELKENGQQRDYIVLTPQERAKGFVNPVRNAYIHTVCGGVTTMSQSIAETYARDPYFYNGTFCVGCGAHFPLDQFEWSKGGQSLDPNKWSLGEQKRVNDLLHPNQPTESGDEH